MPRHLNVFCSLALSRMLQATRKEIPRVCVSVAGMCTHKLVIRHLSKLKVSSGSSTFSAWKLYQSSMCIWVRIPADDNSSTYKQTPSSIFRFKHQISFKNKNPLEECHKNVLRK